MLEPLGGEGDMGCGWGVSSPQHRQGEVSSPQHRRGGVKACGGVGRTRPQPPDLPTTNMGLRERGMGYENLYSPEEIMD